MYYRRNVLIGYIHVLLMLWPITSLTTATHSIEQQLQQAIIQRLSQEKKAQHKTTIVIPKKTKTITIVIDPGHGGHDSGAINRQLNIYEKKVTLSIAKKLKQELQKYPVFHVILTRSQDVFIPLPQRLKIARTHQADLFLSIHADGFIHARARGASVFALSLKGATSETAKWLSEKENYAELGGASLHEQDTLLRSVLINLSQSITITQSVQIGNFILNRLKPMTYLHQHSVEKGAFIVLKSPDIPSLLIETGFLSHPKEAQQLINPHYQQQLAKAIAQGIFTYFKHTYKNKETISL
jgi:N-acetylmuramoyl-L-alanine amidase